MGFGRAIFLISVASLIQGFLGFVNWVMMIVLALALQGQERRVLWLSFWAGLILALFLGEPLGLLSLVFLGAAGATFGVRRLFFLFDLPLVVVLGFLADFFFDLLVFGSTVFLKSVGASLIFALIYFFFLRGRIKRKEGLKLRVG
jgi:hypothetical protein